MYQNSFTEYCGQAPSAPLYIREVPGSNPGAGSVSTSQYLPPSAPILTVPIPNLPVSVAQKALESLSSPPPFEGE
ncbi:hypothetical protein MTP99_019768 [Tenebrio molitor]|nr:hypothetical protein MTP99_019768 [Tenebrio molitor]